MSIRQISINLCLITIDIQGISINILNIAWGNNNTYLIMPHDRIVRQRVSNCDYKYAINEHSLKESCFS